MGGGEAGFVGSARSEELGRQWVAISVWELRVSVAVNGARNGVLFRAPVASCGSASAAWEVRRLPQWGPLRPTKAGTVQGGDLPRVAPTFA